MSLRSADVEWLRFSREATREFAYASSATSVLLSAWSCVFSSSSYLMIASLLSWLLLLRSLVVPARAYYSDCSARNVRNLDFNAVY